MVETKTKKFLVCMCCFDSQFWVSVDEMGVWNFQNLGKWWWWGWRGWWWVWNRRFLGLWRWRKIMIRWRRVKAWEWRSEAERPESSSNRLSKLLIPQTPNPSPSDIYIYTLFLFNNYLSLCSSYMCSFIRLLIPPQPKKKKKDFWLHSLNCSLLSVSLP